MADPYRDYAPPLPRDRDPRVAFPGYLPSESLSPFYTSRVADLRGSSDILRNDAPLRSRAYDLDDPAGLRHPSLAGLSGLTAGARVQGLSSLEEPALAMRGSYALDDPAGRGHPSSPGLSRPRVQGLNHLEDPALLRRGSSVGNSAGIRDVEHSKLLLRPDGPSGDESNILFVDGLPTDCTRREVSHLFRPFIGFKDIRVVHKEPRRSGDKAYVLCFVEFTDAKCAFTAMEALQEYCFDDRKPDAPVLNIQFARFPFRPHAAHDNKRHSS